jgi:ABC-type lipoprotein release transport system permease subunit
MAAITFASMALIIILSAFNGFGEIIKTLYNKFDPDIKIEAVEGKYFQLSNQQLQEISKLEGVLGYSPIIEENVLFQYKENQCVGKIKGLTQQYLNLKDIEDFVPFGYADIDEGSNIMYAILGTGVAAKLDIVLEDPENPLNVYLPKRTGKVSLLNYYQSFNRKQITTGGVFNIQQDFDQSYALVPLRFAQSLVKEDSLFTAYELKLIDKDKTMYRIQDQVSEILGSAYTVKNKYQQQASLYKVMRVEKFVVFLVLTFILLIAVFNMIGALMMLSVEKQVDLAILSGMGLTPNQVSRIVFYQGLMQSVVGGIIGLIVGTLICWVQIVFEFVKLPSPNNTFVVSAYPIAFNLLDFVAILGTVVVVGLLASWYPARIAAKRIKFFNLKAN